MWKKPESEPAPTPTRTAPSARHESQRKARIGPGITIKGELSGAEDVIIEGRIEGKISLQGHGVIVEPGGYVQADIHAASISVAGEVTGDLNGSDHVVLMKTGRVVGNIKAKSVTLETGAQFRGSVDMEVVGVSERTSGPQPVDGLAKAN